MKKINRNPNRDNKTNKWMRLAMSGWGIQVYQKYEPQRIAKKTYTTVYKTPMKWA